MRVPSSQSRRDGRQPSASRHAEVAEPVLLRRATQPRELRPAVCFDEAPV